jgi:phosphoribosylglycinamide formyltransferase-1
MKNLVIFASGNGTNAEKIIARFTEHPLARVRLVVCNNPRAGVLEVAKRAGVPSLVVSRESFYHSEELLRILKELPADLIILAGFLWKVPEQLVRAFAGRIINIHPALLPLYGGKGMYGEAVHRAVIAAGDRESGINIHFVNEKYDEGEVILQQRCTVTAADTPESLAQKVHLLEYKWYPETIEKLLREQREE